MAKTYIGASIKRREDIRFITGRAAYADDIKLPGMLHAAILRPRGFATAGLEGGLLPG